MCNNTYMVYDCSPVESSCTEAVLPTAFTPLRPKATAGTANMSSFTSNVDDVIDVADYFLRKDHRKYNL